MYSLHIASGVKDDCRKLINQFEECDTVRFQDFSTVWQSMKFSAIFTGRQSYAEMLEFCEEVLQIAKVFMLPPYRFKTQIGGLYLLYGLYYKLPCRKIKIRVTLSEWKEILELHNNIREGNHTDANYILSKMIYNDVFYHCAFHREYGLEKFLRVKEVQTNNQYSLLPTLRDMSEPDQILSKIETFSKIYHQAKSEISKGSEPTRALNMYDAKTAEKLIKKIKDVEYTRQHPISDTIDEEKMVCSRKSLKNTLEKGSQVFRTRPLPIILALVFVTLAIAGQSSDSSLRRTRNSEEDIDNDGGRSETLRLATVVFRHAERTPADTYPNDPHINDALAPYGWGQLTNPGKLQAYNEGLWLRKRYHKFLGGIFSPDLFYLQTTAVDRAKMSGLLTAAGLWKPEGPQIWKSNLLWQPVPLHYQPLDEDTLLLVRTSCPAYYHELETVKNATEFQTVLNANKDLFEQLTNLTGLTIANPDDVMSLYGTLRAEADLGLELPEWTKEYFPDRLIPLTLYSYLPLVQNDLLRRLKGGPFVKKIVNDMKSKVNGTEKRKFFMYTGHDSTITNLLGTLKVWEPQMPEYSIMTLIELHEDQGDWNVQIFLRNTTRQMPYPLAIPGCTTACPLDQFVQLLTPVMPIDWDVECRFDDPDYVAPTPLPP
ncbi:prostatic acid phosphatase [Neodiprion lecontei]|uniref:Prostatic acid phosphatase n=1 Tax=Neodiprion lecontei TaxID=441921 RepID=A0A6J0BIN6_NEOLC|nr:prostatic acid phosphatase [Neodiprion lecontei]